MIIHIEATQSFGHFHAIRRSKVDKSQPKRSLFIKLNALTFESSILLELATKYFVKRFKVLSVMFHTISFIWFILHNAGSKQLDTLNSSKFKHIR